MTTIPKPPHDRFSSGVADAGTGDKAEIGVCGDGFEDGIACPLPHAFIWRGRREDHSCPQDGGLQEVGHIGFHAHSPRLTAHVEELPLVRRSIFHAVRDFAGRLPPKTRVLDAGAGEAPYAELFAHCEYVTADWPNSVHGGAGSADIIASLESLPVADDTFGAVLCTEVLEHVPQPEAVLAELHRVLAPKGQLCLTVPFVWPVHEEPFDFYRYSPYALRSIFETAGFCEVLVKPRTGYLSTLGQVAAMALWLHPRPARGLRALQLRACTRLLQACTKPVMWLASRNPSLDNELIGVSLPLGYLVTASKGTAGT